MTTINDIADLARILRENPKWAEAIRSLVLSRELLELPERFAELTGRVDTIAVQMTELTSRVDALIGRFDEFVELTNRNFELVNRRLDHLESNVGELRTDMVEVKVRTGNLEATMGQVQTSVNRVHGRMDNGFGMNYEFKAENNIRSIVGQQMNVRRARILSGARTGPTSAFVEMIDKAEDEGIITEEQSDEILLLDMVLTGQHRFGAEVTLIAAEVSISIGDNDIDRAAERGALLAQACQMPVLSAVVGSRIDEERSALAQARGVSVLIASDD